MAGKTLTNAMDEFDAYIIQGEPSKKEKAENWVAAIGLQQVDGLETSPYLRELAIKNIEGDISIQDVKHLLDEYYSEASGRRVSESENDQQKSDFRNVLMHNSDTVKSENGGINGGIKFDEIDKVILRTLRNSPNKTAEEIASKLKRPLRTIENHFKKLRDGGLLLRVGSKKRVTGRF